MDRKAEFIKANKQLLGKGLDYITLDRKYIVWLEQKLLKAESDLTTLNSEYEQACPKCKPKCVSKTLDINTQPRFLCSDCLHKWQ